MKRYLAFLPVVFCLSVLAGVPCSIDPVAPYTMRPPDVVDSLILYAKFDGNAKDSSGIGNNALTDTCGDGGPGVVGSCYYFPGTVNNWVIFPVTNGTPRLGQTITFSAWVKPIQMSNYRGIAMGKYNAGLCLYQFVNTGWQISAYSSSGWTGFQEIPSASTPTNQWTHLAFSIKGGAGGFAKAYVNGVQYSNTAGFTYTIPHDNTFYIGVAYALPDRFFYGWMDG